MSDSYKVEELTAETAAALLHRFRSGPENRHGHRSMVVPGGFSISGDFSLTARDVRTQEVEWEHSEKNLITDLGRRTWMETKWHNANIAFAPSTEAPQSSRYSIGSDGSQCVAFGSTAPGVTLATHTKTFGPLVFAAPASNRTLGTIIVGRYTGTVAEANKGILQVLAFALLTPPKVQTTTQTLEVVYRVSMNPIS